jgi:hypothetical protein
MPETIYKTVLSAILCLAAVGAGTADVLVDDMEGPKSNQARSGGYWFLFVDAKSKERGNTRILYPDGYGFNFRFGSPGYQSEGCARFTARIGAGYAYPFVGMGMNLDQYKRPYDFCRVNAIEFWARGRGVFKLKLRDTWGVRQTPRAEYTREFTVSPEWRRYSLRPDDFTTDIASAHTRQGVFWDEVCDSITSLIFVTASYAARDAGTVVELEVDNLVIRGIDRVGNAVQGAPAAPPRMDITRIPIHTGQDVPEQPDRRAE